MEIVCDPTKKGTTVVQMTQSVHGVTTTAPDATSFGITNTMTCKTPEETVKVLSCLIIEVFNYGKNNTKLNKKMVDSLTLVGLVDGNILVFMPE